MAKDVWVTTAETGLGVEMLRLLDERGELPVEWKDPKRRRAGMIRGEDWDHWKATRFDRARERGDEQKKEHDYKRGKRRERVEHGERPDFLPKRSA